MRGLMVAIVALMLPGCYATGAGWFDMFGMPPDQHIVTQCDVEADKEYLAAIAAIPKASSVEVNVQNTNSPTGGTNSFQDGMAMADEGTPYDVALLMKKKIFRLCMMNSGYTHQ